MLRRGRVGAEKREGGAKKSEGGAEKYGMMLLNIWIYGYKKL